MLPTASAPHLPLPCPSPCPCPRLSQPAVELGLFWREGVFVWLCCWLGRHPGPRLPTSYHLRRGGWSRQAKPYVLSPWQKGRVLGLPELPDQAYTLSAS